MFLLKDKIIVVTGGNGLLGKEIRFFLQKGGAIVVNADLHFDDDNEHNLQLDITNEVSVIQAIDSVLKKYGRIDAWVNNAYPRTPDWGQKIENMPFDSFRTNVDMHLNGYFICCKTVLEKMKLQQAGCVINMSSIYGLIGPDFSIYEGTNMTMPVAYSAIKGGIVNLTRYLAAYYGQYQIRVNSISPGGIFDSQPESFVRSYEAKVPMRRLGRPGDIAPSVAFLVSDEAQYITGHNLVIDGGWTII